jgi:hypothetical protein
LDADADPDPGIRKFFDPGSGIWDGKNSDPGSEMNIFKIFKGTLYMIKDEFDNFEVQIYKSYTAFYVNKVEFGLGSEFGAG